MSKLGTLPESVAGGFDKIFALGPGSVKNKFDIYWQIAKDYITAMFLD